MINRSFNNFENLFVIDENNIASLEKYKEIWDIKNKKLIESTSYKDKFIDSYGLPGVASNISNDKTIYNDNLDSFSEDCPSTFDLKNGGKIKCNQSDYTDVYQNPIPILSDDEYKKIKMLPRNVNNLNITNNILNDYGLNIKLEEKKVEIKRNYLNVLKIFDKSSNKHKRIWGDNIYWTDNKYFILEKNILKAYSLNSFSKDKLFKVLNNLENVYEYQNKLIIQYKNKVDILDFKSGKVLYSIKDDTKNISSKYIITGNNKIIITYTINNFHKDSYYDSNNKIYTKIFDINNGKNSSKIEINAFGGHFGIIDAKIKTPYLIGRMGPTSNWIDIWNLNTGKLKHIIVPIGSMKTFNVYERKVILGNYNSYFEIYDIKTGKLIKSIEKDPSSNKEDFRFSSDIIKTIIYPND